MKISVKTSRGKTVSLDVARSDSVETIKIKIHDKEGIAPDDQRLTLDGKPLENGRRLADYNIGMDSTLILDVQLSGAVQIFVKTLEGRVRSFDVEIGDTVESLKAQIHEKERVEVDEQRILYLGKQLEDGRSLADYNVRRDSTLHLVLRLEGGGAPCPCHLST